ncbi:MAG: NADH-quinone oxidoreductase subunit NuoF [Anaerolineae bacterium]|nr:MAG: NADH-quinone oxidoreductase subunit NuoF [Anaerolineae bacterium]
MSTVKGSHILLRHRDKPALSTFEGYVKDGGFKTWKQVVTKMTPEAVVNEVFDSGLRGRGGAGFPTGLKWRFIDKNNWPHYVVVNADESEPGTFKDREIMEKNPYQFLEGVMLTAYAVNANRAYIYLRGEFWRLAAELDKQIARLHKEKLLGKKLFGKDYELELYTHLGAGAYICGEETALLESLEGKLGQPRLRPPFPPTFGLYGKPTIVNNVETLANVPLILEKGAKWYRKFGTEKSPGTKIFSLSGRVVKPGNYELPLGTTYGELIMEHGGGIIDGRQIKAIMSAGASSSLIVANDKALATPMDYENVPSLGAQLGSASIIVIDETVDLKWLVDKTVHFFKHESCGKCTPCREGTYWMNNITHRILHGEAEQKDVDLLKDVAVNMKGKCLCALGEFATEAVVSSIERFPNDFKLKTAAKAVAGELKVTHD